MAIVFCRACIRKQGNLTYFKYDPGLLRAFFDLANITIDPSCQKWPLFICDQCLAKMRSFSEFRIQIIANNDFLEKIFLGDNLTEQTLEELIEKHRSQISTHLNYNLDQSQIDSIKSLNNVNTETFSVEIKVKDEFTDFPKTEVFENSFTDEDHEGNHYPLIKVKKEINRGTKPKLNKSVTRSERPRKTPKAPRTVVEVDPAKITVIERTMEEQMRDQQMEGLKPSYKNMHFKCEKCFKGFNFERKLKDHDKNYHKPSSQFACVVCTRTMSGAASLAVHMKKHQYVYQCNLCRLRFAEKPRAIAHYTTVHEGTAQRFPCTHCARVFGNRSSLNGHLRNHHPAGARPQCRVCHKTLATHDSLMNHMLIHSGEKNYSCQVCDKRFRLHQSLAKHMLSHSSARTHYCAPCDVSFKTRASLAAHAKHAAAHASPRAVAQACAQNTCDECGRGFTTRHRLKTHMTIHSGARAVRRRPQPRTRYVCHQCGRGFAVRRTLENHLLTHSGARPHACERCDARFTQRATLRTHLARVHAGAAAPPPAQPARLKPESNSSIENVDDCIDNVSHFATPKTKNTDS